jgi:hypothetical protein
MMIDCPKLIISSFFSGLDLVDNAFGAFLFFNFIYFVIFTHVLWSKRSDLVEDEMANLYSVIHI